MKLSKNKDLQICAIKRLYIEGEENLMNGKTIAILCSVNNVQRDKLKFLDDYIIVSITDTLDKRSPLSFTYADGLKVKSFLERHYDFEQVYVCCDSGESRSTAMAASILCYYGRKDKIIWKNPHYNPNMLVYEKQSEAFGKKVSKLKIKYLKFINDKALRVAINSNKSK